MLHVNFSFREITKTHSEKTASCHANQLLLSRAVGHAYGSSFLQTNTTLCHTALLITTLHSVASSHYFLPGMCLRFLVTLVSRP